MMFNEAPNEVTFKVLYSKLPIAFEDVKVQVGEEQGRFDSIVYQTDILRLPLKVSDQTPPDTVCLLFTHPNVQQPGCGKRILDKSVFRKDEIEPHNTTKSLDVFGLK